MTTLPKVSPDDDDSIATVIIGVSDKHVNRLIREQTEKITIFMLSAFLALIILLLFIIRNIVTKPLSRLKNSVIRMGEESLPEEVRPLSSDGLSVLKLVTTTREKPDDRDYSSLIEKDGKDELGVLVGAFDEMRTRIQSRESALVKAKEEADLSRETAENANKAKSEFLANMSHELRTPMNGVLGMCELLLGSELDKDQKENADTIYKSGNNLLSILNDILDISKIEAGELELENVPFHIATALREMNQFFLPLINDKGLEMAVERDDDVPSTIIGDLGKVQQIFRNLIGNALKFTEKGSITIGAKVTVIEGREYLYMSVEDTGMGIPAGKLDAIFEKFIQADTSVTRQFGGTGLGLAITQQLVYMMGGKIGVESAEGEGSTFWFAIPLDIAAEDVKAVNLYDKKQDISDASVPMDINILAVDDHPVNRKFAQKILTKLGFVNIDIAEDGKEALEMIEKNNYDIVLMDCQMPEIDGYQAATMLREEEAKTGAERLPVIALTANAMVGDREKCLKAGMDDYLSKPIKADKLMALLKKWVGHADENPEFSRDAAEVESEEAAGVAPVDLEHFEMFTDGDPDEEKELFDMFFEQADISFGALEKSCAEEKNLEWKSAAHKMKGSAATLGANPLSEACRIAEEKFQGSKENKEKLLEDIKNRLREVREFLESRNS